MVSEVQRPPSPDFARASFPCHSAGSRRYSSSRHRARMRREAFARLWRRSVRDFRSCLWAVVCGRSSRSRRALPTSGVRQHTQPLVPTFGRRVRFECYPCWFSPPSVGTVFSLPPLTQHAATERVLELVIKRMVQREVPNGFSVPPGQRGDIGEDVACDGREG